MCATDTEGDRFADPDPVEVEVLRWLNADSGGGGGDDETSTGGLLKTLAVAATTRSLLFPFKCDSSTTVPVVALILRLIPLVDVVRNIEPVYVLSAGSYRLSTNVRCSSLLLTFHVADNPSSPTRGTLSLSLTCSDYTTTAPGNLTTSNGDVPLRHTSTAPTALAIPAFTIEFTATGMLP